MITTLAMLITLFCGMAAGALMGRVLARPLLEAQRRRALDRYKKAQDKVRAEWK